MVGVTERGRSSHDAALLNMMDKKYMHIRAAKDDFMSNEKCSQWIFCPICGGKTRIKVNDDTVLLRFPLYCPKCKQETRIDLIDHKIYKSLEPDA
jgi:hypothetical protein